MKSSRSHQSDVLSALTQLQPQFADLRLQRLQTFNEAYIEVTKQISEAKQNGMFANPDLVTELEVVFAQRYFDAVANHMSGKGLPGLWATIQKPWANPAVLYGAYAHIMFDLVPALHAVVKEPALFADDFRRLNRLLYSSGRQFARSQRSVWVHRIFCLPAMWLVVRWRSKAWRQFVATCSPAYRCDMSTY